MSAYQEYSGDYGYDLAHEMLMIAVDEACRPRHALPTLVGGAGFDTGFSIDLNGDLCYDSAHGS
jgi:hypothetical protein